MCVRVVGVFVTVKGSVGVNYLADLDACVLIERFSFQHIGSYNPTFAVIFIFALAVTGSAARMFVERQHMCIRIIRVLITVE